MQEKINNKVLIEIAAQHPLREDGTPGSEFEKRLLKGIELYYKEQKKGNEVVIYVPGSLHSVNKNGEWQTDKYPLSESGKRFLIEHGIPENCIRADEANRKYKGEKGVYNSGDECFVAMSIAKAEDIARIISVCSPVQIDRKALFYIRGGVNPEMYGVGLENTYHNYVGEAFWSLYITYLIDENWQKGFMAEKTRSERDRLYEITEEIKAIIAAEISIPAKVRVEKKRWLTLYEEAKENMQQGRDNTTLISIEINEGDSDEVIENKISELQALLSDYNDASILLQGNCIPNRLQEMIRNRIPAISDRPIYTAANFEEVISIFQNKPADFEKVISTFHNKPGQWFHITDSPRVMNEAISAIENGVLPPIVQAVPNSDIRFTSQISYLYREQLRIMEIKKNERPEKPDKQAPPPGGAVEGR